MQSKFTVARVASESLFGTELALKWIESDKENSTASGLATLSRIVAIKEKAFIDEELYKGILNRVKVTIHSEKNSVRHTMNNFVIAAGRYCRHLDDKAVKTALSRVTIKVDMGVTACQPPDASEYIKKIHIRGLLDRKRKSARC